MSEIDRMSMCSACAMLAPEPTDTEHLKFVPYFREAKELDQFSFDNTNERHEINPQDVLAEYEFEDRAKCSILPRLHDHWHGWVVRTRCGKVLKLGSNCGPQHIADFSRIKAYSRDSRSQYAFVSQTRKNLQEIREKLVEAATWQERIWDFRRRLNDRMPMLAQGLTRQFLDKRLAAEQRALGIEMWDLSRRDVRPDLRVLATLDALSAAWSEEAPPGRTEQGEIRKQVRGLLDRVNEALAWARSARVLLTQERFADACRIYDSEYRTRETPVGGRQEVFERVRQRYDVDAKGVVEIGTDNRVTVEWVRT